MPDQTPLIDELRASLGRLELALNSLPEAVVCADARGRIQWCNAAFERSSGRRRIELLGCPLPRVLAALKKRGRKAPRLRRCAMRAKGRPSGHVYLVTFP